ncbi:MAG: hypothetical protein ACTSRA_00480 [Promethearchaeota archaeon]|nr:MAG: hypothetical protein [Helarchaeota virus Nidhogg Meg22_1012]URC17432.1 MAG: hypothetical protein [Helarchaeota virus Nidhogg Meg22_1214]
MKIEVIDFKNSLNILSKNVMRYINVIAEKIFIILRRHHLLTSKIIGNVLSCDLRLDECYKCEYCNYFNASGLTLHDIVYYFIGATAVIIEIPEQRRLKSIDNKILLEYYHERCNL